MTTAEVLVLDAVQRDIDRLAERKPDIASSGLAAVALALAREMDGARNGATSKSMCAHRLAEVLEKLEALVPAEPTRDAVDELAAQRKRRRSA